MSTAQKSFSSGAIVMGIIMTVLLGVFSWVGSQTFENSQSSVRLVEIVKMQTKQTERLAKSIDGLNNTIKKISTSITENRIDIIRLEEQLKRMNGVNVR